MENASKALIIAGAILISILLISLGILIFNASKGTTDKATATSDLMSLRGEVSIIDMQFSKYNGKQNKETVIKMLQEVADYNKNGPTGDKGVYLPNEATTNYKRKISVYIHQDIHKIPEYSDKAISHTGWDNIIGYKKYIEGYAKDSTEEIFKVKAGEYLDKSSGRDAIYLIEIYPNK